jgi:hypothetical protein
LFPTSRGGWNGNERRLIDEVLHYAWHAMVDDQIPEEIIQDFLDVWWPDEGYRVTVEIGRAELTFTRRCQRVPWCNTAPAGRDIVFPNCRPLEMLKIWVWRWVPSEYFGDITFQAPGLTYIFDCYTVDHELLARHDAQQDRLLNEAYRRWRSIGRWWPKETSYSIRV